MIATYYQGNRTFTVEEATPVPPGPGEVRLEVAYCGVCGTDLHIYHGAMDARIAVPQPIGHEASAVVAEVGEGVDNVATGDHVVVRPLDNRLETAADRGHSHICQKLKFIGIDSPGAFQQSWTVPAFTLHQVPPGVDLKLAALCEPLAVACHDVRLGEVRPGELAVIQGGGPIGLLVALTAREAGARVILSEVNGKRLDFARRLGFDAAHPGEVDLAQRCRDESGGAGADVIFEVSGAQAAAMNMTDLLAIRGRIVMVAVHPQPTEINLFQFFWKELQMRGARVYEPEDYEKALRLIAEGALPMEQLITAVEPLERLPEVFAAMDAQPDGIKTLMNCQPPTT